jgi:hypothetical protein
MSYEQKINDFKNRINSKLLCESYPGANPIATYDEVLALIKKDCKPFLKHKQMLYRGMQLNTEQGIKSVRQDRTPLDSSKQFDIFLNSYMHSIGLPSRNTVMFCLANPIQAGFYGDEYAVFPIGDFNISWFTTIPDMYNADPLRINWGTYTKEVSELLTSNIPPKDILKQILLLVPDSQMHIYRKTEAWMETMNELIKGEFETNKLPSSNLKITDVRKSPEIMIQCKNYYYINISTSGWNISTVKRDLDLK